MIVSEAVMEYIRREIEALDYGRVIIEVAVTSNKIDVLTESRQRFPVEKEKTGL